MFKCIFNQKYSGYRTKQEFFEMYGNINNHMFAIWNEGNSFALHV